MNSDIFDQLLKSSSWVVRPPAWGQIWTFFTFLPNLSGTKLETTGAALTTTWFRCLSRRTLTFTKHCLSRLAVLSWFLFSLVLHLVLWASSPVAQLVPSCPVYFQLNERTCSCSQSCCLKSFRGHGCDVSLFSQLWLIIGRDLVTQPDLYQRKRRQATPMCGCFSFVGQFSL